MGVEDESITEKKEDVPGKAEEPVEERISGAEEAVEITKKVSDKLGCKAFYIVPPRKKNLCMQRKKKT